MLLKNKLLSRENLAKRRTAEDGNCLFCGGLENICHRFFECIVARRLWGELAKYEGATLVIDFESLAPKWLSARKHTVSKARSNN